MLRTSGEIGTPTTMDTVFILHHVSPDAEHGDDAKLIGVYRSADAAIDAISRLRDQPGFLDYPDGFQVDAYGLDEDHWTAGFVSA